MFKKGNVRVIVHGDDFVAAGPREEVWELSKSLKVSLNIKVQMVGMGPSEQREVSVLHRIIRVTQDGWEYEADLRHYRKGVYRLVSCQVVCDNAWPRQDEAFRGQIVVAPGVCTERPIEYREGKRGHECCGYPHKVQRCPEA